MTYRAFTVPGRGFGGICEYGSRRCRRQSVVPAPKVLDTSTQASPVPKVSFASLGSVKDVGVEMDASLAFDVVCVKIGDV
jgi:hypothetical protein